MASTARSFFDRTDFNFARTLTNNSVRRLEWATQNKVDQSINLVVFNTVLQPNQKVYGLIEVIAPVKLDPGCIQLQLEISESLKVLNVPQALPLSKSFESYKRLVRKHEKICNINFNSQNKHNREDFDTIYKKQSWLAERLKNKKKDKETCKSPQQQKKKFDFQKIKNMKTLNFIPDKTKKDISQNKLTKSNYLSRQTTKKNIFKNSLNNTFKSSMAPQNHTFISH